MPRPRSSPSRREFVDDLMSRLRVEVDRRLDALEHQGEEVTLERIEQGVTEVKERLGRELQQGILDQQPEPPGNHTACPTCRHRARFREVRSRRLVTRHGEAELPRRWYHCPPCRTGFAPLDRRLGLDAGTTSSFLRTLITEWAADRVFARCARDLERTLGVQLGESTIERTAVVAGERLRQQWIQEGAAYEAGEEAALLHQPRVVHVSMDGVFAPLREEWKRDGSTGPLQCRGGECKVGAVYEVRPGARGRQRLAWREYTATFGDITAFRPQFAALAQRCGAGRAEQVVFLADGAACNWNLAADYFPTAIQIVDWYHAVQHLGAVAEAFFGSRTGPGHAWLAARKRELWEGEVARVRESIELLPARTPEQEETQREEAVFFANNGARMQYAHYRAAGYQIGSGVMEASCRTVVNQRLDQSGMHWRQETADALVALRAARLSTTPPDFTSLCAAVH
jgi:hypothetical protein